MQNNKELKELLEKSKEVINEVEEKIEEIAKDLPKEVDEFWNELKSSISKIKDELVDDDIKEEAKMKILQAKEKVENLKEIANEFVKKIKTEHINELDLTALKEHLAKINAKEFLEESKKKILKEIQESTQSLENLAKKATLEIKEFFEKLNLDLKDKKS